MYLPQAVPFPPSAGIESDLFLYGHPSEEVELEPALVTCRIVSAEFASQLLPAD